VQARPALKQQQGHALSRPKHMLLFCRQPESRLHQESVKLLAAGVHDMALVILIQNTLQSRFLLAQVHHSPTSPPPRLGGSDLKGA